MKIAVKSSNGRNISFLIPSRMVLNWFTAGMIVKALEDKKVDLNKAQARCLVEALHQYRKTHKEWVLVQAHSADGDHVLIKL